jgi:transposase
VPSAGPASVFGDVADALSLLVLLTQFAMLRAPLSRSQVRLYSFQSLVVTAPVELREQLRDLSSAQLGATASRLRPWRETTTVTANKTALRTLACRYQALDTEIDQLDTQLVELTTEASPRLVETFGAGPDTAGALLVAAGDNPGRLRSEAAFSMLSGASPLEASSGKTVRHRLKPGGDRQANAALYRFVVVRMRHHAPTRAYLQRRTTEGLSKPEIIRCPKRYVAREIYGILHDAIAPTSAVASA